MTSPRSAAPAPSRASAAWTAVVVAVVLLALIVIFVAQNTRRARIDFLFWHTNAPVAVALLVAAVIGAAITAAFGAARIIDLRHRLRHAPAVEAPAAQATMTTAPADKTSPI